MNGRRCPGCAADGRCTWSHLSASRELLRTPAHHAADGHRGRAHRRRPPHCPTGRRPRSALQPLPAGDRRAGARTARPAARHARRALHPHAGRRRRAARRPRAPGTRRRHRRRLLGLEVASTARALGAEVSVLESAPRLLERVLPEALSDWLAERVRHAGVDLRLGARIAGCDRQPHADAAIRHQARFSSPCGMPPPWRPTSWWWPSA